MEGELRQRFITVSNRLEAYMKKRLSVGDDVSHHKLVLEMSKKERSFLEHKSELIRYKELRNDITHDEGTPFAVIPTQETVDGYKKLVEKVINPKVLTSIAVKRSEIYTAEMDSNVIEISKKMCENTYTHVPIIDSNELIEGVFSENVLLNFLASKGEGIFDNELKVRDLIEYIPLEKHRGEIFAFANRDATIFDVRDQFNLAFSKRERLAVIFITHSGKSSERLLGMITAWDVAHHTDVKF